MSTSSLALPAARSLGWRDQARALAGDLLPSRGLAAVFIASRLLLVAAAIVAESFIPRNPALTSGDDAWLLRSLTSWDGWYYLGIVRDGYQADPVSGAYTNLPFPPLYPVLIRILSAPFPSYAGLISVLLSNVAFLLALGLFVRLAALHLGGRRATLAAGLLIIYPFASVFGMAYTESLFLLLMLAAFLAAERRHRAWAGIFLALTVLCRVQGAVLLLPLLVLMLRQDEWRFRRSQAWLLLGPLAAFGYVAYIASVTGSWTAFLDAQKAWGRVGVGGAPSSETIAARFSPYQAALVATLLWSMFLLVFRRVDRLRVEYFLIPIVFIAAEISSGSLEAVGRITMLGFPLVWILASRRSVLARRAWPAVSVGLFTIVAILSFGGYWVP